MINTHNQNRRVLIFSEILQFKEKWGDDDWKCEECFS